MNVRAGVAVMAFLAPLVVAGGTAQSRTEPDPKLRALAKESLATISGELMVPGLRARVEVIRDTWGVPSCASA